LSFENIYVGPNAQGFKTAPKFEAVDKVILNVDEGNFVSSPYAIISDESKWENRSNGTYIFEYNTSSGTWRRSGIAYTTERLKNDYGVEVYYGKSGSFQDEPKQGDVITVVYFKDTDPDSSEEKKSVSLDCDITRSGRTMEGNCPLCKPSDRQSIADTLLASMWGYCYQPYSASVAEVNPLAELGDGINVNGVYGGLYKQDLDFNSMFTSDIGAPADEELDHEYGYTTATERKYSRKFAEIGAEFEIHADRIEARVARTGTGKGFSWSLLEDEFLIQQIEQNDDGYIIDSKDILKVDKDGLHIEGDGTFTGVVSAGKFIGGTISIGERYETDENGKPIYNFTVDSNGNVVAYSLELMGGSIKIGDRFERDAEGNPVYNFMVDSMGRMKAYEGEFAGAITGGSISIGDINNGFHVDEWGNLSAGSGTFRGSVYASSIMSDAVNGQGGYFNGAGLTAGSIEYSGNGALGASWFNGAVGGNFFNNAIQSGTGTYPAYFRTGHLQTNTLGLEGSVSCTGITMNGEAFYTVTPGLMTNMIATPQYSCAGTYDYDGNYHQIDYVSDVTFEPEKSWLNYVVAGSG